jgi:hypothetical protein
MHFSIILVPKYLAYVNFLCIVFSVLALSASVIFTVSVSKHLLVAERQKVKPNNSNMEKSGRGPSNCESCGNYKLNSSDCTKKLFL